MDQFFFAGESLTVIAFSFQDAPEALHRAIIDAMGHTGHTLCHSGFFKLVMKHPVCILETSVAVEQRVRIWVGLDCFLQGLIYQRIVVVVTDNVGNDAAVIEVKNGAEINLVYLCALIPLKFCYIGEPLFIRFVRIELTIEQILGDILRILSLPGATVVAVLDGGLDALGAADSQDTFVVHMNAVVVPQFVIEAPVAFVRTFHMDLFHFSGYLCVLYRPGA